MQPRSLYRRIYMHFLFLLVGVALVSSWVFVGSWPGSMMADTFSRLATHFSHLLVDARDPAARRKLLVSLGDELDYDITLYDLDGHLVANRGHVLPPAKDLRSIDAPSLEKTGGSWFIAIAVKPHDEPPLVLECVGSQLAWHGIPVRKAASLALLLFMIAVAVRPLARRISRPIEMIIDASRRFGGGDLSTRVTFPFHHHHHRHHLWQKHWQKQWAHWQRRLQRHHGDELFSLMHAWNDMAERIERQVGAQRELLANVSHELRSPLARVRVALALLPDDDKTRKRIADIEADLAELDTLIEEILQTSRLEAGKLPQHDARFAVSALYDEVLARATADPLTAAIEVTIDRDAKPDGAFVHGDRALLRRAIFNLVENAAKYGAPPVTLGCYTTNEGVDLVVTDHGSGVPSEDRARMLRPFMRGDRAHTPGRGGVGLGLSFASRVAGVHGGTLTLEDSPRGGLRVRIHLPAQRIA